jgi:hypothetical protein
VSLGLACEGADAAKAVSRLLRRSLKEALVALDQALVTNERDDRERAQEFLEATLSVDR